MAMVLMKGEKNMAYIWHDNCDICGSRLKLYEDKGDPAVQSSSNMSAIYYLRYTCPVCGEDQEAVAPSGNEEHFFYNTGWNKKLMERWKRCRTRRDYVALTYEDREEIRKYEEAEASDE